MAAGPLSSNSLLLFPGIGIRRILHQQNFVVIVFWPVSPPNDSSLPPGTGCQVISLFNSAMRPGHHRDSMVLQMSTMQLSSISSVICNLVMASYVDFSSRSLYCASCSQIWRQKIQQNSLEQLACYWKKTNRSIRSCVGLLLVHWFEVILDTISLWYCREGSVSEAGVEQVHQYFLSVQTFCTNF